MSYCKNLLNGEESKREIINRNIARHAATEGIVLLENDGVLPLKPGKIALFGAVALRTIKGGTGSGEVNERYSVSILEGLEKAEFQIVNKKWINDYENDYNRAVETWGNQMKEAMKISRLMKMGIEIGEIAFIYPFGRAIVPEDINNSETDTAIYVIARQSGEGKDRKIELGENDLQSVEIQSIKFLKEHFKKVILVINTGCTLNLKPIDDFGVNAILYFCQQGEEGGSAFADIILGKVSPSGKLTCTWAKDYADIPFSNEFSYLNGNVKDEFYKEGIFVGYRYYDSFRIEPRYEFGFGLSYTQFNITTKSVKTEKAMVTVVAQVENVGTSSGKEVVQLYISAPKGRLYKEYQRLVDFEKTVEIAPGERQDVILEFALTDCASYDEGLEGYLLEAGD